LFGSLLALRVLFELGVGVSVIQVSAYARLPEEERQRGTLDPAFVAIVNRWMLKVSCWYGLLAGLGGAAFLFFQGYGTFVTLTAWAAFITIGALQFASEGRWSLVQGAGFVSEANLLRIKNNVVQSMVLWTALLLGTGLFSFSIAACVGYASQEYQFRKRYRWLYAHAESQPMERLQHFRSELVSLVRKAGQTYLTGYFVFQIQQPICFSLLGAADSARLGFTQSIGMTFIGIPSIWLVMNFPKLTHHIADREFSQAAALFRNKWAQVCVLAIISAGASWGIILVLANFPKFHDRLMDPVSTGLLYFSMTIQTIALGLTYWPRAFKIEPFVSIAYIQMVATPLFLWVAMSHFGLRGAALGNLSTWVIGAIGILLIFRRYWHSSHRHQDIYPSI
jgi:hypothetical protein